MALELVILVAALLLISLRRLARIPIERPATAMLGGALMVLFGFLAPADVVDAVDWETILLLVGVFLVVASVQGTGLFTRLADAIVRHARSPMRFMTGIVISTGALSALVLNDAVVIFYTPVLVSACRALDRDPVPYLVAEALAANVGSLATPIGNPQNAWIATHAGLGFLEFVARMAMPALLALVGTLAVLLIVFRRELSRPFDASPAFTHQGQDRPWFGLVGLGLMAAALGASGPLDLPMHVVALAVGSMLLFAAPLAGHDTGSQILSRVDWNVLLLFVGLFLLLGGVTGSAGFQAALALLPQSYGSPSSYVILAGITAVLSNLVSNVPAVLLIGQGLPTGGDAFYVLAASSTLAGNATLVAAAANLIVAEQVERAGARLPLGRFVAAGLPAAVVGLAVSVAWIAATA